MKPFLRPAIPGATIDPDTNPNVVAVYGSLRAGCALPDQPDLAGRLVDVGPCILAGILWDLGDYPGIVRGEGRVVGELYEVRDPGVIRELDTYEGYDAVHPERSEYVRRVERLIEPDLNAWVYYFNGDIDVRSRVPTGDWAEHIRRRDEGSA